MFRWASTGPRSHERGDQFKKEASQSHGACFNGAALSRARRSSVKGFSSSPSTRLQRGRALTSAEMLATAAELAATQAASTGPRSHERGDTSRSSLVLLAVGRASTGPRSHERGDAADDEPLSLAAILASTGPRSHERGDAARVGEPFTDQRRFNGAALSRARR